MQSPVPRRRSCRAPRAAEHAVHAARAQGGPARAGAGAAAHPRRGAHGVREVLRGPRSERLERARASGHPVGGRGARRAHRPAAARTRPAPPPRTQTSRRPRSCRAWAARPPVPASSGRPRRTRASSSPRSACHSPPQPLRLVTAAQGPSPALAGGVRVSRSWCGARRARAGSAGSKRVRWRRPACAAPTPAARAALCWWQNRICLGSG